MIHLSVVHMQDQFVREYYTPSTNCFPDRLRHVYAHFLNDHRYRLCHFHNFWTIDKADSRRFSPEKKTLPAFFSLSIFFKNMTNSTTNVHLIDHVICREFLFSSLKELNKEKRNNIDLLFDVDMDGFSALLNNISGDQNYNVFSFKWDLQTKISRRLLGCSLEKLSKFPFPFLWWTRNSFACSFSKRLHRCGFSLFLIHFNVCSPVFRPSSYSTTNEEKLILTHTTSDVK